MAAKTFKAVTWNVFNGTPPNKIRPILSQLVQDGVTIFLMQEMQQRGTRDLLTEVGLEFFYHPPQYVVAWDPANWTPIVTRGVRMSTTPYFKKGGHVEQFVDAAEVILSDDEGRTLLAQSYHLPPKVQVEDQPPRRIAATRESAAYWRHEARKAETRGLLFGGDDNIDETTLHGPWDFMLKRYTGLRQIQAPRPTHDVRKIDDLRVAGLRQVGEGEVRPGGGDHRLHVETLAWKRLERR